MRTALGVAVSTLVAGCSGPASDGRDRSRAPQAAERPTTSKPADPDDARYSEARAAIQKRLDENGLVMEMQREAPFMVVADGGETALDRGTSTVRWAADMLEADFFDARPAKVLPVFLFEDATSYYRGVEKLTGEEPGTPYGFYSRAHGGLFMNIATGGGTLVHEIVHPYVEADFPDAPAWLNEGLGSLFEQSAERDGHIVGLTNWRLTGLQKAIARGDVPTFDKLTHLGDDEFYGDDSGVNYAAARYLLYYLQEKGVLRDLYRAFRSARTSDPSGYQTLVATLVALGEHDVSAFETKWKRYVSGLSFP